MRHIPGGCVHNRKDRAALAATHHNNNVVAGEVRQALLLDALVVESCLAAIFGYGNSNWFKIYTPQRRRYFSVIVNAVQNNKTWNNGTVKRYKTITKYSSRF